MSAMQIPSENESVEFDPKVLMMTFGYNRAQVESFERRGILEYYLNIELAHLANGEDDTDD